MPLRLYDFGGAPGGNGGRSSSGIFFADGDTSRKFPNLSKTTCPGWMIGCFDSVGLIFGFEDDGSGGAGSFFGAGSFIAIALRTLIVFSSEGGAGGFGFSSSLSFRRSSDQSSRSGRFLNLLPPWTLPICIFHLPVPLAETDAWASATVCLAFCSLVGDGESIKALFGSSDSL